MATLSLSLSLSTDIPGENQMENKMGNWILQWFLRSGVKAVPIMKNKGCLLWAHGIEMGC